MSTTGISGVANQNLQQLQNTSIKQQPQQQQSSNPIKNTPANLKTFLRTGLGAKIMDAINTVRFGSNAKSLEKMFVKTLENLRASKEFKELKGEVRHAKTELRGLQERQQNLIDSGRDSKSLDSAIQKAEEKLSTATEKLTQAEAKILTEATSNKDVQKQMQNLIKFGNKTLYHGLLTQEKATAMLTESAAKYQAFNAIKEGLKEIKDFEKQAQKDIKTEEKQAQKDIKEQEKLNAKDQKEIEFLRNTRDSNAEIKFLEKKTKKLESSIKFWNKLGIATPGKNAQLSMAQIQLDRAKNQDLTKFNAETTKLIGDLEKKIEGRKGEILKIETKRDTAIDKIKTGRDANIESNKDTLKGKLSVLGSGSSVDDIIKNKKLGFESTIVGTKAKQGIDKSLEKLVEVANNTKQHITVNKNSIKTEQQLLKQFSAESNSIKNQINIFKKDQENCQKRIETGRKAGLDTKEDEKQLKEFTEKLKELSDQSKKLGEKIDESSKKIDNYEKSIDLAGKQLRHAVTSQGKILSTSPKENKKIHDERVKLRESNAKIDSAALSGDFWKSVDTDTSNTSPNTQQSVVPPSQPNTQQTTNVPPPPPNVPPPNVQQTANVAKTDAPKMPDKEAKELIDKACKELSEFIDAEALKINNQQTYDNFKKVVEDKCTELINKYKKELDSKGAGIAQVANNRNTLKETSVKGLQKGEKVLNDIEMKKQEEIKKAELEAQQKLEQLRNEVDTLQDEVSKLTHTSGLIKKDTYNSDVQVQDLSKKSEKELNEYKTKLTNFQEAWEAAKKNWTGGMPKAADYGL